MSADEVGLIRDWADSEGWEPGLHDGPAFHAADPNGFFIGLAGDWPVSCISCVRYGDDFGFLGQYIVHPEFRGQGHGLATWNAGMAHVAGRNVGLDGVLAQIKNYERSGFRLAHHNVRYVGAGGGSRPAGLIGIDRVSLAAIEEYDRRCFPAARTDFLREWLRLPESAMLAAMDGDAPCGYGVVRRTTNGHKIGPLFADDTATAMRILNGLISTIPGQRYCIDMPESSVQPGTSELVDALDLKESFRTARMYTHGEPIYDRNRVFAITTMELG